MAVGRERFIRPHRGCRARERGPAGFGDRCVCIRAAARTLYLAFGVVAKGRAEDCLSRSARGTITLAGSSDLGILPPKRQAFYASTGLFLLGWMAEALEVYVILYYLGGPAMALSAISIGALSVFIKGGTFFIPGGLGTQDGGNLLLLEAFGYSGITGITFALLRRFRELVWIGVGLLCLAMQGRRVVPAENLVQESGIVPDPFLLPRVAPAVPGAGLDRNGIALLVMAGKSGIEQE